MQDSSDLELSADERQYFKEKQTLKVSVLTDWKPFSYLSEEKQQGLPVFILQQLSEDANIALEWVPAQSYEEAIEQLVSGQTDICGFSMRYKSAAENQDEWTLVPYLQSQMMLISHKNTDLSSLSSVMLAEVAGRTGLTLNQKIPTQYYATQEACLISVRSGQEDIAICDAFTASLLMRRYSSMDLVSSPTTIMMDLGFGIHPDSDSRLLSALQKTIAQIPRSDINHVLMTGADPDKFDILQFVYQYPFEITCFGFAVMFVAILSIYVYTKIHMRNHQALQGYEESYRLLTDIFGEAGMEYDYLNDRMTFFGKSSNLDIPPVVTDFRQKLRNSTIRLLLTDEQFEDVLMSGMNRDSFSIEFQCGVTSGDWVWYRLIYTVICTTESHRRPIRLMGCLVNIDAEYREKEQLLQLSSNDQLTGLLNRTAAEKEIRQWLETNPESLNGMLIILDVDFFKKFNDQKGHFCGDDVLYSLGKFVQEIALPADILCRWGGDEFLFFTVDEPASAERPSSRFSLLANRMRLYSYQGDSCPVTLSAGGVKSYPGCTFESLFEQADKALYLAKQNGRDQLWLSAPSDHTIQQEVME